MCVVSEPNKYKNVNSYLSAPVNSFTFLVSGKVALMKLLTFCTLEIPKFKNLDIVSAFPLSFEDVQRRPIVLLVCPFALPCLASVLLGPPKGGMQRA